ncbi:MAG: cytochrome c family protein, partial [Ignavibacteria bacterium]|nr:cytochrome c family protein [Ignavibacteria bacterium]
VAGGPPAPPDSMQIIRESFSSAALCGTCHPTHFAEWETSMHAYAMTDPVFLRLQEIGQERSGNSLDQFCVKCHTPLGSLLQETPPGFDPASLTPLAADAIHCDVCHRIESFDRGRAIKSLSLDKVRQGPITDPQANGFHESRYDARYADSGICSPCHDILSDDGLLIEMTSTEWDLSAYSAMGLECQACHMPVYSGSAAVGSPARSNLHRHFFTGVDYPLTSFPGKLNTIAMVDDLLKNSISLTVSLPASVSAGDTLDLAVSLLNSRTGHSIPSGSAFERQMWVEVVVTQVSSGDTVFTSGLLDGNLDLMNHHSEFVTSGAVEEDLHLALYRNIPRKNGEEILFFWEADEILLESIPAFQTSVPRYPVPAPATGGTLQVSVRVLFRTFPPYFLRTIDLPELVDELIVFEMESFNGTVTVL